MTEKDKARIEELHRQKKSLRYIANDIGVSYNAVWLYLQKIPDVYVPNLRTKQVLDRAVFPAIAKWIIDHRMSINQFAKNASICIESFRQVLVGKNAPSYDTICKVIKYTGMTFEEAFSQEAAGE
jgi:DNA-binding phage protein